MGGAATLGRAAAILLGTAIALCVLVFAEGASRWLAPRALPDSLAGAADASWGRERVFDPLLFWRMRPNLERDGLPYTNRLGLRWPEIPEDKPADEFRILSLGESSTFARHIPWDANYSHLVERRLGRVDGRTVRVVNAGGPGDTLFQGVTWLVHRGFALEPDAVMVYFGFNDFLSAAMRDVRDAGVDEASLGLTDRQQFERRRSLAARLSLLLIEHSNLFRLAALREPVSDGAVLEAPLERRVPGPDREALLDELRRECERRGVRLVVLVPWYREFDEHARMLRRFGAETGVPVVDLPELLGGQRPWDRYFASDGIHPNEDGHRLVADAIVLELRRNWGDAHSR